MTYNAKTQFLKRILKGVKVCYYTPPTVMVRYKKVEILNTEYTPLKDSLYMVVQHGVKEAMGRKERIGGARSL